MRSAAAACVAVYVPLFVLVYLVVFLSAGLLRAVLGACACAVLGACVLYRLFSIVAGHLRWHFGGGRSILAFAVLWSGGFLASVFMLLGAPGPLLPVCLIGALIFGTDGLSLYLLAFVELASKQGRTADGLADAQAGRSSDRGAQENG